MFIVAIPIEAYLFRFLIKNIKTTQEQTWEFDKNHWFGKALQICSIEEKSSNNWKSVPYSNKISIKIDCPLVVNNRFINAINKELRYKFDEALLEWVKSRKNTSAAILDFIFYYNLEDSGIDTWRLNKRVQRMRESHNIQYTYKKYQSEHN